jgi:aspartate/methionine/tyrosine aminotransferase
MNYKQFCSFREELLKRQQPIRFDGLDPASALPHLRVPLPENLQPSLPAEVMKVWSELFRFPLDSVKGFPVTGVRAALQAVCACLADSGYELLLPSDVYPTYWDIARSKKLQCRAFDTIPALQLEKRSAGSAGRLRRKRLRILVAAPKARSAPSPLPAPTDLLSATPAKSCLLLPNPLAPSGRHLNKEEVARLTEWLGQSPDRRLILDTVYEFATRFHPSTLALWQTGKVCLLYSIAKSWLAPRTFGLVLTDEQICWNLSESFFQAPSPDCCAVARFLMTEQPDLPNRIQDRFERCWRCIWQIKCDQLWQTKTEQARVA